MADKRKKNRFKVVSLVIILVFLLVGIFGGRMYHLSAVTKGAYIDEKMSINSAIVVVDMQKDTWNNPVYKNKEKTLQNINSVIQDGIDRGYPIIYIRQEFNDNILDKIISAGMYAEKTEGSELIEGLLPNNKEIVISKYRNDSFSSKVFEKYLLDNQIGNLYIVGADSSGCVYKTGLGAVQRKYKTTIVENAIFSINEDAHDKIVKKYLENGIEVSKI